MPDYVPLWCKSNYSFLEGASDPEELVTEAHRLGLRSLALTDRDGVYGMVRAHQKARELGVQLIVGAEITLFDESNVILLAMNRRGYANLCKLISKGRLRSVKGISHVSWEEVCDDAEDIIALWGGQRSLIAGDAEPDKVARQLVEAFGDRVYALLTRHREATDAFREHRLRERAERHGLRTVAGMEVLYHTRARRELQDVMTCIRHGVSLSTAGRLIQPNAEHALRTPHGFAQLYADDPGSVERTNEIAGRCTFSLSQIHYRYPSERLPSGKTSSEWLRELTLSGVEERYPEGPPANVLPQIEKELQLVRELDYDGYFLTMWEIVRYCREHDILCQGRGSAANSAVCYCLGITAVDPMRLGLLFERFISRERAEPPDIDLDIEHDRREEVIQHVYGKYGRRHAAMVANFIRYRTRSALRDVGKALGLTEVAVERIVRHVSHYEAPSRQSFVDAGFDPENPVHAKLLQLTLEIQDMPRHLSIHPGGFLLGHEPVNNIVPIENATMPERTVIQWDKDDVEALGLFKVDLLGLGALNVVHRSFDLIEQHTGEQWTMATVPPDDEPTYEMIRQADTVGVFQIESRAQMSMLPRLKPRNYYDLVIEISIVRPGPISGGMVHPYLRRRNGEEPVTYPHESLIPVLEKTKGIPLFQEQVMQLAMVAADYTPGEADQLRRDMAAWRRSGRIERHRERLTSRMKAKGIAEEFATRVFEQIRGFGEYGFPESHAASFALIAYATSWLKCHHPAAFLCAMLNAQPMGFYSAATLVEDGKHHGVEVRAVDVQCSEGDCTLEPLEVGTDSPSRPETYPTALQSSERLRSTTRSTAGSENQPYHDGNRTPRSEKVGTDPPGGPWAHPTTPQSPGRLRSTTRSTAVVRPCSPQGSDHRLSGTESQPYQGGFAVRMGLRYVKGLSVIDIDRIVEARQHRPFISLEDFTDRTQLDDGALSRLAESGALECFKASRRDALWDVFGREPREDAELDLVLNETSADFAPLNSFESINWDYHYSSHSTRGHPLAPLRDELSRRRLPDAATVSGMKDGAQVNYAGLVICRQRPGTARGVVFMTLEDETGFVNLVVWDKVFQDYKIIAKTEPFLGVTGKLQVQSGVTHLVAKKLWVPKISSKPVERKSRDFH